LDKYSENYSALCAEFPRGRQFLGCVLHCVDLATERTSVSYSASSFRGCRGGVGRGGYAL